MGGLTYGAIEAGAAGITAPRVLSAFAVAAVALAAFGLLQARGEHPMLPLSLFRSRTVSVSVVIGFAFMVGYYGLPFVMSLYLQQLRGLSALGTGVTFVPMMVVGGALNPFTARLAERFGARTLIVCGLLSMTAGLVAIGLLPATAPAASLAALMILVGLAGPLVMPPVMALLLHAVPARQTGVASGVFNTSRQVGGALAVAVFGALLASRATFLHGLQVSLLIAAGVAVAAAFVSVLIRPSCSTNRKDRTMTENTNPVPEQESSGAAKMFGDFAPALVRFTDDTLFGQVWTRPELSPRDRSLVTVAALTTAGNTEQLAYHSAWPGKTASPGPS